MLEETKENKNRSKLLHMFNSQEAILRSQGLKKERDIQKVRPGRSAMQWYCGLRLFLKNIYNTYITVPYCTWYVVLRPLFIFRFDKRAQYDPV